jgi:NAD-dependent histone deacetylase SIR2
VPRVLINKEIVGDLGSRPDDVIVLGDCDAGVRKLVDALGWRDELEEMWFEVGGKVKEKEAARLREQRKAMTKDELLEEEIEKLTGEVDAALQISKDHTERVNNQVLSSESSSSHTPATSTDSEKDQPGSKASVPTNNELGIEEPPSTPATTEKTTLTTEKTTTEVPAEAPAVDSKASLDVTLPQNKPNKTTSESTTEEQQPASRI